MEGLENTIQQMVDEAIAKQREEVEARVREVTARILARRIAKFEATEELPEGEWLDREQVMDQYGVSYAKIRDAQITRRVPTVRQGRKVLSKREDVDELFRRVA